MIYMRRRSFFPERKAGFDWKGFLNVHNSETFCDTAPCVNELHFA